MMPAFCNKKKIEDRKKKEQIDQLTEDLGLTIFSSMEDKLHIQELEDLTGNLLMEIAQLKGGF